MYSVVVGWYPSENSAKKVFFKVKSNIKDVFIEEKNNHFIVKIGHFSEIEKAIKKRDDLIKKNIFCGVCIE